MTLLEGAGAKKKRLSVLVRLLEPNLLAHEQPVFCTPSVQRRIFLV